MTSSNESRQSRPGMLGDGTEEQNLDQKGDPAARVTKDKAASGMQGSVTNQVSNDLSTAKETPEDTVPKDNSHTFT